MKKITLEVCCGSVEDVLQAADGGADRVELNSCLFHGGLTPSIGELLVAKKAVDLPIMTMVRPRQGGFCYTKAEYATALADAEQLLTSGQAPDVFYGVDVIREMVEFAEGRIQILPGAGVNGKNIDRILRETGCDQIHVARFTQRLDPSTANNRDIFYGGALYPPEDRYDVIDGSFVAEMRNHC